LWRRPLSYGPNFPALFGRAAELVDKILRGAKPGDIPVEQPTKFEFVLNDAEFQTWIGAFLQALVGAKRTFAAEVCCDEAPAQRAPLIIP
jgi:hypothetical protein